MDLRSHLLAGQVIPAHPLALTAERRLDEGHQRGLTRYYLAAGAGGIAVGVHTTQFAIRDHGLYQPVLAMAREEIVRYQRHQSRPVVSIAGAIGPTDQAVREAETAAGLGYDAVLLSLGGLASADDATLLSHCRRVAKVLPLFGFYLQPAVGGRVLGYDFWRRFAQIPEVVAIKIAPFNRYRTLDVVRAVVEAERDDVALYTGNDDSIVTDLLARFPFGDGSRRIVGGLLGQWAVGTRRAVEWLRNIRGHESAASIDPVWLTRGAALTDFNAALFDVPHEFAGSIAGIHDVLHRQRLLPGTWCLEPGERLSPGQREEIDRTMAAYPELLDDDFIARHRDEWIG